MNTKRYGSRVSGLLALALAVGGTSAVRAQTFNASSQHTEGQCADFDRDGGGFLGLKKTRDVQVEIQQVSFLEGEGGAAPLVALDYRILNKSKRNVWVRFGSKVQSLELGPDFGTVSQDDCIEIRDIDTKEVGRTVGGRPILGIFGPKPTEANLRAELEYVPPSGAPALSLPYEGTYTFEVEVAPNKKGSFRQDRREGNDTFTFSVTYRSNLNFRNLRVVSGQVGENGVAAVDLSNTGNRPTGPLRIVPVIDGEPQNVATPQLEDPLDAGGQRTIIAAFEPAGASNVLEVYDDETGRLLFSRPIPFQGSLDEDNGNNGSGSDGADYRIARVQARMLDANLGLASLTAEIENVGNEAGGEAPVDWENFQATRDGSATSADLDVLVTRVPGLEPGERTTILAEVDLSGVAPDQRADALAGTVRVALSGDADTSNDARDFDLAIEGSSGSGGDGEIVVDLNAYEGVAISPSYAFDPGVLEVDMVLVNQGVELEDVTWTVRMQGLDPVSSNEFQESVLGEGDWTSRTGSWVLPPDRFADDSDPIRTARGTVEVEASNADRKSFDFEVEYYGTYPKFDYDVVVCSVDGQGITNNTVVSLEDGQERDFHVVVRNRGDLPIHPDDQLRLTTFVDSAGGDLQQVTRELDGSSENPTNVRGDCTGSANDPSPRFRARIELAPVRPGTYPAPEANTANNTVNVSLSQEDC